MANSSARQHQSLEEAEERQQQQQQQSEEEEEGAQRLCGLKRGMRRSKDELFQDFCKRAGVRPKPKNIYYVPSEQEQAAFQTLSEVDEQLYATEDNQNVRRASMCVEPTHFRQLANSNLSLHQLREPSHSASYQSRTLPRSFLKQRTQSDSQESMFASSQTLHAQAPPRPTHFFTPLQREPASAAYYRSCENVALPQTLKVAYAPTVQWPAAIPSSPANFNNNKLQLFATPKPLLPLLQRVYAFDEQRRTSQSTDAAFDLDQIERERRRSHASLLGAAADYDLINGTAV